MQNILVSVIAMIVNFPVWVNNAKKSDRMVNSAQKMKKRCFIVTLWPGHVGLNREECSDAEFTSAAKTWWDNMANIPEIQYRVGQLEVSAAGELHAQIAVKTSRSVRAMTMVRRWSGHWEPARNPTAVYAYAQKTEGRVEFLGEEGEKPQRDATRTNGYGSLKAEAIRLIVQEGLTPEGVAKENPEAYFTHHRAIDRLWERLNPDDTERPLWRQP